MLLLLVLCALGACKDLLQRSKPLTEADKKHLPTAALFARWLEMPVANAGKFTKDYSLGTHELDYEYETEDVVLTTGLMVESSASEARSTFNMFGLGVKIGLGDDVDRKPCGLELGSLGDQVRCELLLVDDIQLGHHLRVRRGKHMFWLIIAGVELSTPDLVAAVRPFVEDMTNYDP